MKTKKKFFTRGPAPGLREWGGTNKFWGGTRSLFMWIREGHGVIEIYSRVDQTNKVKTKKKVFSSKTSTNYGYRLKILAIFYKFLSEDQKKKVFVPKVLWNPVWAHQNYENTGVLGLNLHSSSPEPVNFFGAQSSLGGAQFLFRGAQAVIWGGTAPEYPPWRRACFTTQIYHCWRCDWGARAPLATPMGVPYCHSCF